MKALEVAAETAGVAAGVGVVLEARVAAGMDVEALAVAVEAAGVVAVVDVVI